MWRRSGERTLWSSVLHVRGRVAPTLAAQDPSCLTCERGAAARRCEIFRVSQEEFTEADRISGKPWKCSIIAAAAPGNWI